jgi:transcription initiation factor TFIID TATA-box-binding protein
MANVVSTADLRQKINLNSLSRYPKFSYDPEVYHCAYIKDSNMRGKVSIFASGKMISIGTKKEVDAARDLMYAVNLLKKVNAIKQTNIEIKIQNIVATINLNRPINLTKLAEDVPSVVFEPEQFPAAMYPLSEPLGATALVFGSGKVVLAGIKSSKSINKIIKHVVELIEKYLVN